MARRLQVNRCILCEQSPCECGKPAKKNTLSAPKILPVKKPESVQKVLASSARKAPEPPRLNVEANNGDEDLHRALRVLAEVGLMSRNDREKYRVILLSTTPTETRAATWRARREASHGIQQNYSG